VADADGLDPGVCTGWIQAQSDCVDCSRVTFTVLPVAQDVEEPSLEPPQQILATWGRIKGLCR
jgi:hypothetical protein